MEDLSPLLEKSIEALRRDLTCIFQESTKGLSAQRATSLTSYIKLLRDIIAEERETEEELRKRVEEILKHIGTGGSSPPPSA